MGGQTQGRRQTRERLCAGDTCHRLRRGARGGAAGGPACGQRRHDAATSPKKRAPAPERLSPLRHGGSGNHSGQERALVRAPLRVKSVFRTRCRLALTHAAPPRRRARLATNPLNRYTVIDYFSITPFYEREGCVNEAAVAAGRHRSDTQCAPGAVFTRATALFCGHAPFAPLSGSWGRRRRARRRQRRNP